MGGERLLKLEDTATPNGEKSKFPGCAMHLLAFRDQTARQHTG